MEFVLSLANFAKETTLIVFDEGWVTSKENVEDDACRPDIAFMVINLIEDFRGDIIRLGN